MLPRLIHLRRLIACRTNDILFADNKLYYYDGNHWAETSGEASELQKLMESGTNRMETQGANATNYGTIGFDAIDLSASTVPSSLTGNRIFCPLQTFKTTRRSVSTALGEGTLTSGQKSLATGLNAGLWVGICFYRRVDRGCW